MEIPGYDIQQELGSGGMATVYLAVQENLHREVALKVMTPGLAVDETYCQRFLKEGRIAAQLNHLNLLTVYDIGVHDNHYYMASEYLPGGTARDKMNEGMTSDDMVHIIADIAQGLQYAHSKGFVHRDVKPGNLLFRANGDCVLGDFGIAKAVDSNTGATKLGTAIGTPHYMSPEQAKGEKVDHRTDLYSLGVVFYEMLTGKPPFDAEDPFSVALMQINEPTPQLPPESQQFQALIEKLMEKDRENRYGEADDFLDDLEAVTGYVPAGRKTTRRRVGADTPPVAGPALKTPPRGTARADTEASSKRSRLVPLAIGGTLLIAVIAGGLWMLNRPGEDDSAGGSGQTVEQPDDGGTPANPPPDSSPADEQSERIAQLKREAEQFIEEGTLITIDNDSAVGRYRAVLAIDPEDDAASLALRDLANRIESAAEVEWAKGELQNAYTLLMLAVREFPNDSGIRYLLEQIRGQGIDNLVSPFDDPSVVAGSGGSDAGDTASDAGGAANAGQGTAANPPNGVDRTRVNELIRQADQYFDANVFSHPPGKNAMDLYRQVVELEPGNRHAQERLTQIAGLWVRAAETQINRGNCDRASAMIERGLQAKPDHPELLNLKQIVDGGCQ